MLSHPFWPVTNNLGDEKLEHIRYLYLSCCPDIFTYTCDSLFNLAQGSHGYPGGEEDNSTSCVHDGPRSTAAVCNWFPRCGWLWQIHPEAVSLDAGDGAGGCVCGELQVIGRCVYRCMSIFFICILIHLWFTLAGVMCILCCNHRKAPSDSSMAWLKVLAQAGIPVLVCLTHADKLVAELMPEPGVMLDYTESKKCVEDKRQVCGGGSQCRCVHGVMWMVLWLFVVCLQ